MTLGVGRPSTSVTSTLPGLRSRWMIPFWWACCTAWQTATNNSSRARTGSRWRSQYSVIGTPLTSSMTKNGWPAVGGAAVVDAGDVGVVHQGQRLPLGVEPGQHRPRVHAGLDQLERHLPLDRLGLLGPVDGAHAPLAEDFEQRVPAGDDLAHAGSAGAVGLRAPASVKSAPSDLSSAVASSDGRRVSASDAAVASRVAGEVGSDAPVASPSRTGPAPSSAASSASTRARSSASPPHSRSR